MSKDPLEVYLRKFQDKAEAVLADMDQHELILPAAAQLRAHKLLVPAKRWTGFFNETNKLLIQSRNQRNKFIIDSKARGGEKLDHCIWALIYARYDGLRACKMIQAAIQSRDLVGETYDTALLTAVRMMTVHGSPPTEADLLRPLTIRLNHRWADVFQTLEEISYSRK